MDIQALRRDLDGLKIEDNAKIVQQKSRDFYWYSPVLKRQLDHVTADIVVSPKDEAEVIRVLAACHRHGVPVTPRIGKPVEVNGLWIQALELAGRLGRTDRWRRTHETARASFVERFVRSDGQGLLDLVDGPGGEAGFRDAPAAT